MKRLKEWISDNLRKLISIPRNAYMERESLLYERIRLLRVREIIDDLQVIINSKRIDIVCKINYNGFKR